MTIEKLFRQEVLETAAYHLEDHKGIKLNQNEAPWDIPAAIKTEIIEELLKTPWNRYPLTDFVALKKKISKIIDVWPDNLLVANGSNVLIQALTMATAVNGKVMVFDPSFSVYEIEGSLLGNKIIRISLGPEFQIPIDEVRKKIKKEKPNIIFIANPNAPSGNLFDQEVLREIIELAQCLVVIDEAYYPFSGFTCMNWIKEYENLVILRTFSKAYALGGLRLGWMIADPDVTRQVEKCLLPFRVNKMTFIAASVILDHMEYVNEYVKVICKERERVYEEMCQLRRLTVYRSDTNFILFEVDSVDRVFNGLLREGVIIRQVTAGVRLPRALRVSIGSPEENDAFLRALKKVLG